MDKFMMQMYFWIYGIYGMNGSSLVDKITFVAHTIELK